MELSKLKTDPRKMREGVETEYMGARIGVASWSDPEFQACLESLYAPHRNGKGEIDDTELASRLLSQAMVRLVKWWDLTEDGEPIPTDEEHIVQVFEHPATSHIRDHVFRMSKNMALFMADQEAKSAGNLPSS